MVTTSSIVVAFGVTVIAYMAYGTVVIRATANPPINMNDPSDPMRLLPYLNREQYGERPLLLGPNFDAQPTSVESSEPKRPIAPVSMARCAT